MIEINGKVYRNIQEQVEQNKEDIAELKEHGTGESYSAGTGINISDENVISIDNTVETKANATNRFVSKDNLTDYSINEIIVGNSQVDSDNVDLRAVYSQDVKSEVSLEPTSTIIRTMSGTDTSTIGLSATEIDITTPMLKYGTNEVATKNEIPTDTSDLTNNAGFITIADVPVPTAGTGIDITSGTISVDSTVITKNTNGNVQALYLPSINSIDGEDSDCKGRVELTSGARRGIVTIEAEGESNNASIEVRGSTSGEGIVTITGDVTIDSTTRPKVGSGLSQEQVAYLSDMPTLNRYYVQFDVYSGSDHYVISAPFVTFDTLTTGSTTFADIKQYLQEYMFAIEDNKLANTCGCINSISSNGCTFYYNDNGTTTAINISSSDAVIIGR